MQRFGRKVVYVVVGDGVEEEQAAKKVKEPSTWSSACEPHWTKACLCVALEVLCWSFLFPPAVSRDEGSEFFVFFRNVCSCFQHL